MDRPEPTHTLGATGERVAVTTRSSFQECVCSNELAGPLPNEYLVQHRRHAHGHLQGRAPSPRARPLAMGFGHQGRVPPRFCSCRYTLPVRVFTAYITAACPTTPASARQLGRGLRPLRHGVSGRTRQGVDTRCCSRHVCAHATGVQRPPQTTLTRASPSRAMCISWRRERWCTHPDRSSPPPTHPRRTTRCTHTHTSREHIAVALLADRVPA